MATATSVTPSSSEVRLASRIENQDDHAIIGVDNAIARGVTLTDLGVTLKRLQEARLRFVRHGLATLLFERSDRHLSARALAYIKAGEIHVSEVSIRSEDRELLQKRLDEQDWDTPNARSSLETIERACRNSSS